MGRPYSEVFASNDCLVSEYAVSLDLMKFETERDLFTLFSAFCMALLWNYCDRPTLDRGLRPVDR